MQLQRKRRRLRDSYEADLQVARARRDWDELNSIGSELSFETGLIEDDIAVLESRYLLAEAERLLVPRPKFIDGETYVRSEHTEKYHLTPETMVKLRRVVREERSARSHLALTWVAALTGVVGALTGLAAILLD
jgi:hypothetical protein